MLQELFLPAPRLRQDWPGRSDHILSLDSSEKINEDRWYIVKALGQLKKRSAREGVATNPQTELPVYSRLVMN